jgi:hypothetical protein
VKKATVFSSYHHANHSERQVLSQGKDGLVIPSLSPASHPLLSLFAAFPHARTLAHTLARSQFSLFSLLSLRARFSFSSALVCPDHSCAEQGGENSASTLETTLGSVPSVFFLLRHARACAFVMCQRTFSGADSFDILSGIFLHFASAVDPEGYSALVIDLSHLRCTCLFRLQCTINLSLKITMYSFMSFFEIATHVRQNARGGSVQTGKGDCITRMWYKGYEGVKEIQ